MAMASNCQISIHGSSDNKDVRINRVRFKRVMQKAVSILGIGKTAKINITFLGAREMRRMNRHYFGQDRSTDVIALGYKKSSPRGGVGSKSLSRAQAGLDEYLGDILICTDKARSNAKRFKTDFFNELSLYGIHGLLHLLGYEDKTQKGRNDMEKKQNNILLKLTS